MERRRFLNVLAAGAAGLVFDPEYLLWVPGQKSYFLPPPPTILHDWETGISMRFVKSWQHPDLHQIDVLYCVSVNDPS